jgi:hypothetical protein
MSVKSGIGPGDLLRFHNPIYDSTDTTVVGSDEGSCTRIAGFKENKKGSWECDWTYLNNGADSITVETPTTTLAWVKGGHGRHGSLREGKVARSTSAALRPSARSSSSSRRASVGEAVVLNPPT